jgi:hypothetical protein
MTTHAVSLVVFVDHTEANADWVDRAAEIGEAEGHIATELRTVGERLAYVVRFHPNTLAATRARAFFDSSVR